MGFAALLVASAAQAQAQVPDGWQCEDKFCVQTDPLPVASLAGVFAHARDVSAERDEEGHLVYGRAETFKLTSIT